MMNQYTPAADLRAPICPTFRLTLTPHLGSGAIRDVPKLIPKKPMPKDLVMDLIAITRLLYAKEQAGDGHPVKHQEIADIGRMLKIKRG